MVHQAVLLVKNEVWTTDYLSLLQCIIYVSKWAGLQCLYGNCTINIAKFESHSSSGYDATARYSDMHCSDHSIIETLQ